MEYVCVLGDIFLLSRIERMARERERDGRRKKKEKNRKAEETTMQIGKKGGELLFFF